MSSPSHCFETWSELRLLVPVAGLFLQEASGSHWVFGVSRTGAQILAQPRTHHRPLSFPFAGSLTLLSQGIRPGLFCGLIVLEHSVVNAHVCCLEGENHALDKSPEVEVPCLVLAAQRTWVCPPTCHLRYDWPGPGRRWDAF